MAKQLRTDLIIGGKTTSGFDGLAGKLGQLGAVVDQLGGKIREWESDAVEVYKDYETRMLEAEGAMTTQYKSASERARAMATLEAHVSDWAANSIFHTDDISIIINTDIDGTAFCVGKRNHGFPNGLRIFPLEFRPHSFCHFSRLFLSSILSSITILSYHRIKEKVLATFCKHL